MFTSSVRFSLFAGCLFVFAACSPLGTPAWMPNGYRFQDDTPLSSPAPTRPWVNEAEIKDAEKISANTAAWQASVSELLEKAVPLFPQDNQPFFIRASSSDTAQTQAFDHYLRQALVQKGYVLSTLSGQGHVLVIHVSGLQNAASLGKAVKEAQFEKVPGADLSKLYLLTLSLIGEKGGAASGTASVVASLPFEKAEYHRFPGFSYVPAQGKARESGKSYTRQ